ncbi:TonB-dependent receptor plug domain-containing protein [Sphingosinicella rhizophila]|uniref:TonB-dependent receptor n=1 Tax=Sphingosinicella rhizophila TaxID=3050082 RepID=A0ABU3Q5L0_9SPHN|nr:TonB-dependent receptor [Sphingosinicella sp. GR2756]MDT9598696.1 TonB-dependent receptor [Sphingosinicella sp. GR2756]
MKAFLGRAGWLSGSGSALAVAAVILCAGSASAQTTAASADETPEEQAGAGESGDETEIVVTGSRIERAGFEQPTPTTVLGNTEIRQAAQPNLQQVLNQQPQVRNSSSATTNAASTNTGVASVDLRGLGAARTLTLINGRRFVGDNNLNFVPTNLVERVELVTGGASAAWGSDAVAGVVNIILNDKLEGIHLGANTGISSRGDGFRYGFDGAFGTEFAGGKGHFMIGAEYLRDKGIGTTGFNDRPWFGAGLVTVPGSCINAGGLAAPCRELRPGVPNLGPLTYGGTVLSGANAGLVFNNDGTLRAARPEDAINLYTTINVASPVERIGSYARLSYDIGNATIWVDAAYGRAKTNQSFIIDPADAVLVSVLLGDNAFLPPQLAATGEPFFVLGRYSRDTFFTRLDATRETFEGAVGIDGTFGNGWKYSAHFSHGEVDTTELLLNSSIPGNFARALDAVQTAGGIACRVNADPDPTNDDPACVPFNPFGEGNASQAAADYVRGTQSIFGTRKLDSAGIELQGDPFSTWAGPVTVAVGAEARWEEQIQDNGALDKLRVPDAHGNPVSIFGSPLYAEPLNGGFNVKEAFAEALVPLINGDQVKVELNGAARYSDYSRSGGIWSWKVGGTARLFDSLLLRVTRSRDIRAPSIGELFNASGLAIREAVDRDPPAAPGPGYDPNPMVRVTEGGNPDLVPEISRTWTVGGSFTPSFFQGFSLSVDYYDIKINGAIGTPDTASITADCAAGDTEACDRITRDPVSGTITDVRATNANIASLRTNGIDIEAAYVLPMSRVSNMPGALRFRALATYVNELVIDGVNKAGSVGDIAIGGIPHWRGNFSATYQSDTYGLDLRIRYVGGGKFDASQPNIVNNDVGARTYVDLGAQFKVADKFTFFGNVRNLFDKDPPLVVQLGGFNYDSVGRYFTAGIRLDF